MKCLIQLAGLNNWKVTLYAWHYSYNRCSVTVFTIGGKIILRLLCIGMSYTMHMSWAYVSLITSKDYNQTASLQEM